MKQNKNKFEISSRIIFSIQLFKRQIETQLQLAMNKVDNIINIRISYLMSNIIWEEDKKKKTDYSVRMVCWNIWSAFMSPLNEYSWIWSSVLNFVSKAFLTGCRCIVYPNKSRFVRWRANRSLCGSLYEPKASQGEQG